MSFFAAKLNGKFFMSSGINLMAEMSVKRFFMIEMTHDPSRSTPDDAKTDNLSQKLSGKLRK